MKKIFYTLILALTFSPVLVPVAVFADTAVASGTPEFGAPKSVSYVLLTPLPCVGVTSGQNGTTCTTSNGSSEITSIGIQGYLLYLFKLLIALAVFLSVVMTIFGGFKYMTTEAVMGKSDARKTIEDALKGLLLALASYIILYTINPNFVNISKVAVPKLNVKASQGVQNSINALNNQQYLAGNSAVFSANDANAAAIAAGQTAQQDMNALAGQLYADGCVDANGNDISQGDPNCFAMENQYLDDQNTVDTTIATQNTQAAISKMANAANALNTTVNYNYGFLSGTTVAEGDTNVSDAQTAIQTINNAFEQTWPTIPNGDATDKQAITDQMAYSEASVVNTYNTNVVGNNLIRDRYTVKNIDPTDDIAAANALIKTLKTNAIPNQTNSNGLITGPLGTLSPTSTLGTQYAADNKARITVLQNAIKAVGGTPVQ